MTELLDVVVDGHSLYQVNRQIKDKRFAEKVRRLCQTDESVRVWIDWVIRTRKFVEGY